MALCSIAMRLGPGSAAAAPAPPAADRTTMPVTVDSAWVRRVDAIVDAAVADGFAGQIAILRDGQSAHTRAVGFSDSAKRIPVTDSTLFHVASITKYVTAVTVLLAAEVGRLALDDSLGTYCPGTRLATRGVTLADLLAHRSGLGSSYAAEQVTEAAEAVAAIAAAAVEAPARGTFRYSNDGYDLLAIVLERAYGARFEDVVRTRVLAPAGLRHAAFWSEVDVTNATRVGQPLRARPEALLRRNYGMLGSAGFLVTALDLARLGAAIQGGVLLADASIEALNAPRAAVQFGAATFGAFRIEHDALGSCISARGYEDWGDNAILNIYLRRGLIVAVVTSKGPPEGSGEPFRTRIARAIEGTLAEAVDR